MRDTNCGVDSNGKVIAKAAAMTPSPSRSGRFERLLKPLVAVMSIYAMIVFGVTNLSMLKVDSCHPIRNQLHELNTTVLKMQDLLSSSKEKLSIVEGKLIDAETRLSAARGNMSIALDRALLAEERVRKLETSGQNENEGPKSVETSEHLAMYARRNRNLPECAKNGTRASAFMMVFMGHSGSTAILTELHNHSQVLKGYWEPVDHQKEFNATAALEIASDIFERGLRLNLTAGFKIRPAHIVERPDQWRALVKKYGVRIIWQYRNNLFKGAVGEYAHRYLHDESVVEGLRSNITREERCQIGAGCTFRIEDFNFLRERILGMRQSTRYILRAVSEIARDSKCVREVPYEDYLYDRDGVMRDLQKFLGLTPQDTAPDRFKATGDSLCETIENWDEVCDVFYGCPLWQHMLDDARNNCFCRLSKGVPTAHLCGKY